MHSGQIRVLELSGAAVERGGRHGAIYSEQIKRYLTDRLALAGDSSWSNNEVPAEDVIRLASSTLAHHERYAPDLFEEMGAMAGAAGIGLPEAVVVGGFTDIVDLVRAHGPAPVIDECTAVLDPVAGSYAQTWDMHMSAGEFVVLLEIHPDTGPSAYVQTTVGCLGQIGMNEVGIGIGINNLTSIGRPGVTWPFVVRKALQQSDFDDAVKCVLDADLAGGHNFAVIGPDGRGVNIEAMPGSRHVTHVDRERFVHANHCLFTDTASEEGFREPMYVEDSDTRQEVGRDLAGDHASFFAHPRISKRSDDLHATATCGAVVMEPARRTIDLVWGIPGDHPWETFRFSRPSDSG